NGPMPSREDCETRWGEAPSGEVVIPALAKTSASGPTAAFEGAWWGIYSVGREVALLIKPVSDGRVEVTYMLGSMPAGVAKAESSTRYGRMADGGFGFAGSGRARLRVGVGCDGNLVREWLGATGSGGLTAVLHRLSQ